MTWIDIVNRILKTDEMISMKAKLDEERASYQVLPDKKDLFNAFNLCPYHETKVVILGQDPYPEPSHPHGLAFSSLAKSTPASLSNIFREIWDELYKDQEIEQCFKSNDLTPWAKQGVLLINTCLTVRAGIPGSHLQLGWEFFTNEILAECNKHENSLVFMLWGAHAKKYANRITDPRHLILQSAHPSPMSVTGFFGNMHFRTAEVFLRKSFYNDLAIAIDLSIERERIKARTEKFLEKHGIAISKGNVMHIYNIMFEDIGLFFDELIPELKAKHTIDWRT